MKSAAALASLTVLTCIASERIEIYDGKLPAPGASHCIRLHADGAFEHATVRVNGVNAGELPNAKSELDITGYLSTGASNTVEVRPRGDGDVERVWAWISPLVYVAAARFDRAKMVLEVTITNTTENTAQAEIGDRQFTVSPGTSSTKQIHWTGARRVRLRAVSDGLDREFVDEADVVTVERR
jgi:hypothetical protein